ncbi:MAG: glycosyltransferase family 39 protein, partial [Chloroflexota bacterium]
MIMSGIADNHFPAPGGPGSAPNYLLLKAAFPKSLGEFLHTFAPSCEGIRSNMNKNPSTTHRLYCWLAQISSQPSVIFAYLVAITLTGTFLRVYKLGEWSFWGDEMFTVGGQEDGFNYNLLRKSLSLALIQTVTAVHGLNEWNARIVPAVIGIITIPVLFFIARKIFDVHTALLSATLLALSPWHLYWSQNARFYTALLVFYSLALFYFYLGTEQDKPRNLVLCLVFFGLAAKERLLALFFVPVILVYLLLLHILSFEKPKGWNDRNLAIFVIPGLIGGLLFAGPYLMNLSGWLSGFGFANNNPFWLASGFAYYVGFPVICVGSAGGWYLVRQKRREGLLLCVSAVVPLLLLLAVSPFHYTANRYAFLSLTSW